MLVRLNLIMQSLNLLISNKLKKDEGTDYFLDVIKLLKDLVTNMFIFVQGVTKKAGERPKKGRKKMKSYHNKMVQWKNKVIPYLNTEVNKKILLDFEAQLGDTISLINLAISTEIGIDVKKCLEFGKENNELLKECEKCLHLINENQGQMIKGLDILLDKQRKKEKKALAKLVQSCERSTPKSLIESQKLNLEGAKILFNLISQRQCTEEEGLKASVLTVFGRLRTKSGLKRLETCAKYFFTSWDLDGNGYLSKNEVEHNLQQDCYLASLREYYSNKKVPFSKAYEFNKVAAEEIRLDLENLYMNQLKEDKFVEKLFTMEEKSYYNNEGEINQEGFTKFCIGQEDCGIEDLFSKCIEWV
ncbi:phosphatase 2a regulatory subunit-related [Anaeramoeba flamelloides]|uniref:Phosphatase 2a regulatory subunit-related n=1 Tax=Anaeramoeba flamelloides TaxID=1746091 RepID=A0ABQ8Z0X3_9EUKA|nr:phosphatase 2a regulatory subunit-related [Anaeramoeba flamelloides]